ncbi:(d)CMP kinase [Bacteriovorax sp. Seq25_V]|uniref:(d)CMP kinase n=1 Tax=Bacteriovorax sp. Seq25_V TaxID=1201288 RepID=UPI00038A105B|nr:(d)CMP kinase [Bacteriovorax sp. Seq25_V]EQC48070.1 cytidylate kinase [Bacteriovorax sp. Seq25_V]
MSHCSVIAIDGPSGSGKSTVAKRLASELGILYIDTGAMFRALAYSANERDIDLDSDYEVSKFLEQINLEYQTSDGALIKIDGEDLSEKIRAHHVSKLASIISQIPAVREYLLKFQRSLAESKTCVMEGRDIGTVVFPEAFSKFFITASIEIRAKRRYDQLVENGQSDVDMDQLIKDVAKRDQKDMGREVAPLKKADDAELVDTSQMALDNVISHLADSVKKKALQFGIDL